MGTDEYLNDSTAASASSDWGKWFQDVGGGLIGAWSQATYQQPYEIQKLKIQALGEKGYYLEGKPSYTAAPGGISPMVLIGGGLLLVVLVLSNRGRA